MHVSVTITDAYVSVQPWVAALERPLTIRRRVEIEEVVETPRGFRSQRKKTIRCEQLYTKSATEDVGYAYVGLFERICQNLQELGITFDVINLGTPVPPLDMSRITVELRPGQPEILAVMGHERNGTIKAATGLGKTETICQFLKACGKIRVAIVTFKGAVRDSIFARVRKVCPDKTVCMLRGGAEYFDADVYVLVDKSLHRLDPASVDVVIIDEVHGAGASGSLEKLFPFAAKRVYGFSATPSGRHDKSDLGVECLCGPIRVDLTYEFSVDTGANVPLYVYVYKSGGPNNLKTKPDFLRDKLGIWYNSTRNRLIASLCQQIPAEEQTLIVCRTLEHALNLRKLLPDYVCVFREPSAKRRNELEKMGLLPAGWSGLPGFRTDPDGSRQDFEAGVIAKAIVTPIWREGMDFTQLRWLVRADGTVNEITSIQIGGRLARRTAGKDSAALIDFYDAFPGFEHRSEARIRRYTQEGWIVQKQY